MFYSLLGHLAWWIAKRVVRRKAGALPPHTPLIAAGALAGAGAVAVALRRRAM
jgi:hypothetical protein